MELIETILNSILDLPWIVKGPGLGLIAILLLRAVTQFLTIHPIRAATSVVYALIVGLVLSKYGQAIAEFIAQQSPPPQ